MAETGRSFKRSRGPIHVLPVRPKPDAPEHDWR